MNARQNLVTFVVLVVVTVASSARGGSLKTIPNCPPLPPTVARQLIGNPQKASLFLRNLSRREIRYTCSFLSRDRRSYIFLLADVSCLTDSEARKRYEQIFRRDHPGDSRENDLPIASHIGAASYGYQDAEPYGVTHVAFRSRGILAQLVGERRARALDTKSKALDPRIEVAAARIIARFRCR